MSQITNDNVLEMFNSIDGDLEDYEGFDNPPDAPVLAATQATEGQDTMMDCGLDNIEQVNFSGLGPAGIVADNAPGQLFGHQYQSFPCLVQTELQEAAAMPLASNNEDARSETEAGDAVAERNPFAFDQVLDFNSMDVDDDTALAAAADVMSLEPPFWPSSGSDISDDDECNDTFANNGWGTEETRRGWAPEQAPDVGLPLRSGNRPQGWERRGAISD